MSTKELAYTLIDRLSQSQLNAVIDIMKEFSLANIPEVPPDDWDLEMIKRAENENNGETVSIEAFAKELGIDYGSFEEN